MTKYLCDDGNAEIEIEADTALEAAQEYVDGGDWGEVDSTIWINVYVTEVLECDHPELDDGVCDECGEACTHDDEGATDELCHDDECPIHGSVERLGDRESYSIAVDPDEPSCTEAGGHDWRSPYELLGGLKENPGVWGHGGGVIIREVCMHCGCKKITDTWAQNPEDGVQGLESVEYEEHAYTDEELAEVDWDE